MTAVVRTPSGEIASSPCGGLRARVAGTAVLLRASGALWIESAGMLVVADLHLEKGSAYAARGQLLPPFDTGETLRRLAAEVEALAPRAVVLLGDTLHDGRAEARMLMEDEQRLGAIAQGRQLIWVVGNHDADGPSRLPGEVADELTVEGLRLRHEPQAGPQPGETAGHLHPCARVVARGRGVRRRCFITDGQRVILPAFGAYAGGLSVRDAAFKGMFAPSPLVVALGADRAHPVPWSAVAGD
ncbi:MAG: ligase-associated DNA damage response endonuclease PdeM [Caulobacteraceae bacterium]|nr:ligase-associated DNA damage response endonuclease PdeM [Caulobacteraceae bacterium]